MQDGPPAAAFQAAPASPRAPSVAPHCPPCRRALSESLKNKAKQTKPPVLWGGNTRKRAFSPTSAGRPSGNPQPLALPARELGQPSRLRLPDQPQAVPVEVAFSGDSVGDPAEPTLQLSWQSGCGGGAEKDCRSTAIFSPHLTFSFIKPSSLMLDTKPFH